MNYGYQAPPEEQLRATDVVFVTELGQKVTLHHPELIELRYECAPVPRSSLDLGGAVHTAILRLHGRPDGAVVTVESPVSEEPTPIYERLTRERA